MARTVFTGGRVFDGRGTAPAPADVAVEDGRIVDVGPRLDGDVSVDATGRTLLPGLFDCHVHVTLGHVDHWRHVQEPFSLQFYWAARNLEATVRAGITSVRDAGGADLGVKRALELGWIVGPRIQLSLTMLSQTGGHGGGWLPSGVVIPLLGQHPGVPDNIVDGPDQVRQRVRQLVEMGADVIKVATSGGVLSPRDDPRHAQLSPEELEVLVTEASVAGRFVMAHAQSTAGIKNAIRAGIRSIEHGIYLDDEAASMMLERGTWLVPTLVAPLGVLELADGGAQLAPEIVEKARLVVDRHRESFRLALSAGVRIAMGTDSGVTPHGRNLRELTLMAEGGMPPAEVLVATTRSAAELLGVGDELGTLEPGKAADLVMVDGDPYRFDDLDQRIAGVWLAGERVA
jgi:imidazolonepropionase-like amidohydrolase